MTHSNLFSHPFIQRFGRVKRMAARLACLLLVTVAVWSGAWLPSFATNAMAVGSKAAGAVVTERAANELDRVAGAGTSDKIEGTVQETVGSAKRAAADLGDVDVDSMGNKLDGKTDELAGKVKRDVGRAKSAAADLGDEAEDQAEGFVESIKDFFD